jgi:hypothetical protein
MLVSKINSETTVKINEIDNYFQDCVVKYHYHFEKFIQTIEILTVKTAVKNEIDA